MNKSAKTTTESRQKQANAAGKKIQERKPYSNSESLFSQIRFLQKTIGNRSVRRLMKAGKIQAKPLLGTPGDRHEQEADRIAGIIMQNRRQFAWRLNLPAHDPSSTPAGLSSSLQQEIGEGMPLSYNERNFFEPRFGLDLSTVRLHTGHKADQAADAVKAKAFTAGNDVVFRSGEYQPFTTEGKHLLAHELVHTMQQGSTTTVRRQVSEPVEADEEREEDIKPEDRETGATVPGAGEQESGGDTAASGAETGPGTEESGLQEVPEEGEQESTGEGEQEEVTETAGAEISETADEGGRDGVSGEREAASDGGLDSLEELNATELALVDFELAEHQRWGSAAARVGTAGSAQRAAFIADAAGSGVLSGFGEGLLMGAGMGALTRAAEVAAARGGARIAARAATRLGTQAARFTPLPAIGAVIGGVMSAYNLASRDWAQTGETIGRFGEGASIYDTLANSIAAISEIIDVATNVLNVIAGIIGAISVAMWIITVLTVGIASPLALTLSAIAGAIGIGTMILDGINAVVLRPLVTLFRALHTFTSEADPRDIVTQGTAINQAASASAGFVGGMAGGIGAAHGTGKALGRFAEPPAVTPQPDHPSPPPAAGDGPTVTADPPPVEAAPHPSSASEAPAPHAEAPVLAETPSAATPQQAAVPKTRVHNRALREARNAVEQQLGRNLTPEEITHLDIMMTLTETIADTRKMVERGGIVESPVHDVPGEAGPPHLRRGERMPGTSEVTPHVKTQLRRSARALAEAELMAALENEGLHNPRTQLTLEYLTPDQVVEFRETGKLPQGMEFDHYMGLADFPEWGHLPDVGAIVPAPVHRGAGHGGDTTAPRETASQRDPHFEENWGWQEDRFARKGARRRSRNVAEGSESTGSVDRDLEIVLHEKQRELQRLRRSAERHPTRRLMEKIREAERYIEAMEGFFAEQAARQTPATPPTPPVLQETSLLPAVTSQAAPVPGQTGAVSAGLISLTSAARTGSLAGEMAVSDQERPGPVFERVNPAYSPPPGTPRDLVDIRNSIMEILAARARAEQVADAMGNEEAQHQANQQPIQNMADRTVEAITATQAHQQLIERRQAANQQQQQREEESRGVITGYANRAAGLSVITVPLRGFERFTSLADHLPNSPGVLRRAKRALRQMNRDSGNFLNALSNIDQEMGNQQEGQPQRSVQIAENTSTITSTAQAAVTSGQTFADTRRATENLNGQNNQRIAQTGETRSGAESAERRLKGSAAAQENRAENLAFAMRLWAQNHRQARLDALRATSTRLKTMGYINIREHE